MVPGSSSRYVLDVSCFFLGRAGDDFYVFRPANPPRPVPGAGSSTRATHLYHRTRFLSFRSGVGWPAEYSVLHMFFVLPIPPPLRELGGIWVKLLTHSGAQDRISFGFNLSLFRRHFLAPHPPLWVVWRWLSLAYYPCSLWEGSPFFHLLGVPCRCRSLTVQRCESGF